MSPAGPWLEQTGSEPAPTCPSWRSPPRPANPETSRAHCSSSGCHHHGVLVHALRDVSGIPDLYPLGTNSTPGVGQPKTLLDTAQGPRGDNSAPLRTTGLTTFLRQQVPSAWQPNSYAVNSLGGPVLLAGSPGAWDSVRWDAPRLMLTANSEPAGAWGGSGGASSFRAQTGIYLPPWVLWQRWL